MKLDKNSTSYKLARLSVNFDNPEKRPVNSCQYYWNVFVAIMVWLINHVYFIVTAVFGEKKEDGRSKFSFSGGIETFIENEGKIGKEKELKIQTYRDDEISEIFLTNILLCVVCFIVGAAFDYLIVGADPSFLLWVPIGFIVISALIALLAFVYFIINKLKPILCIEIEYDDPETPEE